METEQKTPNINDYCSLIEELIKLDYSSNKIQCDTCEKRCIHSKLPLHDFLIKEEDDNARCLKCTWYSSSHEFCRRYSYRISPNQHQPCFKPNIIH